MYPIVHMDAYKQHCFWFKFVYVYGLKGIGMVLEVVKWELRKDLDVKMGCVNWVGLLLRIGVQDMYIVIDFGWCMLLVVPI